jgi:hypothetical protein
VDKKTKLMKIGMAVFAKNAKKFKKSEIALLNIFWNYTLNLNKNFDQSKQSPCNK